MTVLGPQLDTLGRLQSQELIGTVAAARGLGLYVDDLPLPVGAMVRLELGRNSSRVIRGEVVGFDGARSIVMLFGSNDGIAPGMHVHGEQTAQTVAISRSFLGRIIDGLGRPIDGGAFPSDCVARPLDPPPTCALHRRRIDQPLPTGVRVIDTMLTVGKGQRVGIFSGPGLGKSTLVAMIARNSAADVNVLALVGERGREVREFIERSLGPTGLAKSVVVVATGDESPLLRVRAAMVASAVAEFFRDQGADVLLMMDSLTRLAQAQRQIGLTIGEQPATKGYTPSVFAMLPKLLERAGSIEGGGSITGFYAVLVEGDDLTEPISDAARGVLDGHVVLSRKLAGRGHYPAVDMQDSVSRVADLVCDEHHQAARRLVLKLLAARAEAEELINIGAYAHGSNADCDVAIALKPKIDAMLQQGITEEANFPHSCRQLIELAAAAKAQYEKGSAGGSAAGGGGARRV